MPVIVLSKAPRSDRISEPEGIRLDVGLVLRVVASMGSGCIPGLAVQARGASRALSRTWNPPAAVPFPATTVARSRRPARRAAAGAAGAGPDEAAVAAGADCRTLARVAPAVVPGACRAGPRAARRAARTRRPGRSPP